MRFLMGEGADPLSPFARQASGQVASGIIRGANDIRAPPLEAANMQEQTPVIPDRRRTDRRLGSDRRTTERRSARQPSRIGASAGSDRGDERRRTLRRQDYRRSLVNRRTSEKQG